MTCIYVPAGTAVSLALLPEAANSSELPAPELQAASPEKPGPVVSTVILREHQPARGSAAKSAEAGNPAVITGSGRQLSALSAPGFAGISLPAYTRGVYLSNYIASSEERLREFIRQAARYQINTFVIDVQKKMIPASSLRLVRQAGIFPVARVVVFEGGLAQEKPPAGYVDGIMQVMTEAAANGFAEIQLDYIRFADHKQLMALPMQYKYNVINEILARAREQAQKLGVYLSADLFGRVTLNQNDHIGQKLENFGRYMDTIYPMLYPSHYYFDPARMKNPYGTVKEGVANSVGRIPHVRVVAYIQGFSMKVSDSGLGLVEYIRQQIQASQDAGGQGWIIWNPRNRYEESYQAIEREQIRLQQGSAEASKKSRSNAG